MYMVFLFKFMININGTNYYTFFKKIYIFIFSNFLTCLLRYMYIPLNLYMYVKQA